MHIKSTEKPKWFQLRWKLSNALVSLARKVYPENPEVTAFYYGLMLDQIITGQMVVRVGPDEVKMPSNHLTH